MLYPRIIVLYIILSIPTGLFALQNQLPSPHQEIQKIYHQVLQGIGADTASTALPTLQLTATQTKGAYYLLEENTIVIELALYEVCQNLGSLKSDALAFLLGHELGHFYHQTTCGKQLGAVHTVQGLLEDLRKKHKHKQSENSELRADYFGGIAAHLAGFRVFEALNPLISATYQAYKLDKTPIYPPLEQRLKVADHLKKGIQQLVDLYYLANWLNLLKAYREANECYALLLENFTSPETQNNYAVSLMREALELSTELVKRDFSPFEEEINTLAFLFEIDPDYRLNFKEKRTVFFKSSEELVFRYDSLLGIAKKQLEGALTRNPSYKPAHLNLALWHLLAVKTDKKIRWVKAEQFLTQYNNLLGEEEIESRLQARFVEGIIRAQKGQKIAALNFFEEIEKTSNNRFIKEIARFNKQQLLTKSPQNVVKVNNNKSQRYLKWDGVSLQYPHLLQFQSRWPINEKHTLYKQQLFNSTILDFDHRYLFQFSDFDDKSIPFPITRILEETPDYLQNTPKGSYYVYLAERLIIRVNELGAAKEVILFYKGKQRR